MWFDSWPEVWRVAIIGVAAYTALLLIIRLAGKRTLSDFNSYDFVVSVAFGSVLATILLNGDVTFAEGATAFLLLAASQFVIAFTTRRVRWLRGIVNARPTVLVRDGVLDQAALRRYRLSEDDLRQAVRMSGSGSMTDVAAAVLESNGNISVVTRSQLGDGSALARLLED